MTKKLFALCALFVLPVLLFLLLLAIPQSAMAQTCQITINPLTGLPDCKTAAGASTGINNPNLNGIVVCTGTNCSGSTAGSLTGDVTTSGLAATIGAGKVTNAMLAGSIDLTTKVTGALPVQNGGTGMASVTAYAIVAGGTTSTGALQQVSGLGTAGQVLTSNGAGTLPTWQSAGSGTIAVQADGSAVGARSTLNIVSGTGITPVVADTGSRIDITHAIDTAVVQTHANYQSGSDVYCAPSGASGTTYTCNLSPALTAYTTGMTIPFRPDVAASGTPTLQINGLASPKTLRLADGISTPTGLHLPAGQLRHLWYDGTYFRVLGTAPVNFSTGTSVTLAGPSAFYVCTSTCTVTLPVPVAGYQFCVMNDNNVSTVITLAALGSSARYENTARTAYGTAGTGTLVSGGAAADKVCLLGLDSTHYLTVGYSGTWTAN